MTDSSSDDVLPSSEGARAGSVRELELPSELIAVPAARRFVAGAVPDELVDDAELVTAELVTNAVLHGAAPVRLRVRTVDDGVRLEVEDAGATMPMRLAAKADAMTGRGLGLVDTLSREWRVERVDGGGKVVWAELAATTDRHQPGSGSGSGSGSATNMDVDALLAAWADDDLMADMTEKEPVYTVELGTVPTDLLLAAKAHVENLVREFTLEAAAASPTRPLRPDVARMVETVVNGFADARAQMKRQALQAAASGQAETDLSLTLPASAADAGEAYLRALDEADRYARAALLLSLETPPAHRVFRRWYVEALVGQLRAHVAGDPLPAVSSFTQRLADEVATLAPLQELVDHLRRLQAITTEVTAAQDIDEIGRVVVTNAVRLLHAHSARLYRVDGDDLRLVAVAGDVDRTTGPQYETIRVTDDLPVGVAVSSGAPVIIRNVPDLEQRFPQLSRLFQKDRSVLVAPLVVADKSLGVLGLSFLGESRVDEQTQLSSLTTLADVTAHALDRAAATSAASAALQRLDGGVPPGS